MQFQTLNTYGKLENNSLFNYQLTTYIRGKKEGRKEGGREGGKRKHEQTHTHIYMVPLVEIKKF